MSEKPWGGAFEQPTDQILERFSESVSFDRRLYQQDIRGSLAHAKMLAAVEILSQDELQQITSGLESIDQEIAAGDFEFRTSLEDVHMNIERALIDRIGDTGRKLHTGRSRNDQVSTDFRLWIRDQIDALDNLLVNLQRAFVHRTTADDGRHPARLHPSATGPAGDGVSLLVGVLREVLARPPKVE